METTVGYPIEPNVETLPYVTKCRNTTTSHWLRVENKNLIQKLVLMITHPCLEERYETKIFNLHTQDGVWCSNITQLCNNQFLIPQIQERNANL